MLDKEILDEFTLETKGLLKELEGIVETLEDYDSTKEFPTQSLQDFSQRIDRIMGAAKTLSTLDETHLGLQGMATISEICKRLGYKAAESKNRHLLNLFAGFWADTLEFIDELLNKIENKDASQKAMDSFSSILMGRLEWLSTKVQGKGLPPSSQEKQTLTNASLDLDALMADLGL